MRGAQLGEIFELVSHCIVLVSLVLECWILFLRQVFECWNCNDHRLLAWVAVSDGWTLVIAFASLAESIVAGVWP